MGDRTYSYRTGAAAIACIAAGPIFLCSLGIAAFVDAATRGPVAIGSAMADIMTFAVALPIVTLIGGVLAVLPVGAGTFILFHATDRCDPAAAPAVWVTVGAAAGATIVLLIGSDPEPVAIVALSATGAACAAICRRGLRRCLSAAPPAAPPTAYSSASPPSSHPPHKPPAWR